MKMPEDHPLPYGRGSVRGFLNRDRKGVGAGRAEAMLYTKWNQGYESLG
jgi:hypothetical protein